MKELEAFEIFRGRVHYRIFSIPKLFPRHDLLLISSVIFEKLSSVIFLRAGAKTNKQKTKTNKIKQKTNKTKNM